MRRIQNCLAILALSGLAAPAAAQSFDNTSRAGRSEVRIQAGVVIPLGGGGTAAERAPRVEAWSDHRAPRTLPQARLRFDQDPLAARPVRIGVNFSGASRLMLNGREMRGQDDRHGISTLGWVGIGVGVAVIAFGVYTLDAFNKDNGLNGL